MEAASLYRRFFAFLFDWIAVNIMFLMMVTVGIMARQIRGDIIESDLSGGFGMVFLSRLWFFLFVLYHIFFSYNGGQTPSKMLFKIKVVSLNGSPLTFLQATVRTFSYIISFFMLFGFLVAILSKKNRSLHDFIGNSLVLEADSGQEKREPSPFGEVREIL